MSIFSEESSNYFSDDEIIIQYMKNNPALNPKYLEEKFDLSYWRSWLKVEFKRLGYCLPTSKLRWSEDFEGGLAYNIDCTPEIAVTETLKSMQLRFGDQVCLLKMEGLVYFCENANLYRKEIYLYYLSSQDLSHLDYLLKIHTHDGSSDTYYLILLIDEEFSIKFEPRDRWELLAVFKFPLKSIGMRNMKEPSAIEILESYIELKSKTRRRSRSRSKSSSPPKRGGRRKSKEDKEGRI